MVRNRFTQPEMRSMYRSKSGELADTLEDPDKSLALVVSKNVYQRFLDYATEAERLAAERNRKAEKLMSVKKAAYEMSKNWDNTVQNIMKRRREELLSKKQRRKEEIKILDEQIKERNKAEQEEVLRRARELLLHERPMCRKVNSALRASECYRELDAQVEFQKSLKEMVAKNDEEYVKMIKEDIEKFEAEERVKAEIKRAKQLEIGLELKKYIDEAGSDAKKQIEKEIEAERRDRVNMNEELKLIKECEAEEVYKRKKQLQKLFKEAIAEKELYQAELKEEEEFQSRVAEVYNKTHARIKRMHRTKEREQHELRTQKSDYACKKFEEMMKARIHDEDEKIEKVVKEKEMLERKKMEDKRKRQDQMRAKMRKYREEVLAMKEKQLKEEKELKAWDLLQRFKKDEYNKTVTLAEKKREWTKKKEYADMLRRDMVEKEAERKREKLIEELALRSNVEKANEALIAYGNKVIEESRGVRPLYPILKAVEELKKELGVETVNVNSCGESTKGGVCN